VTEGIEIPRDVVELVEGGAAAWMGTCDGARVPEAARIMGARVHESRRALTAYLPAEQSGRTLQNLRECPELSIFFCVVFTFRAVQIKGALVRVREAEPHERAIQERYSKEWVEANAKVGMPPELIARMKYWPSMAIEMSVREMFVQTPGPGAGAPLR
jgi:hypothetical protein